MNKQFKREEHVYESEVLEEIIKDTIRFFNGTPVVKLVPEDRFYGTGVYAIYYTGKSNIYKEVSSRNRLEFALPIYVGKAVPRGWRKARIEKHSDKKSYELLGRLREHARTINQVSNLELEDFSCRFMILEKSASNLIGTVEASLIRHYQPLWNVKVDGFGNHDPGKGRYNQAKSEWDVLHSGRAWASKCKGEAVVEDKIIEGILDYYKKEDKK